MAENKIELYGKTNKIIAEVNAHILGHTDLLKFLYYTDSKYDNANILGLEEVTASKVYDELFFVYKRVPDVIDNAGAYLFMNLYRQFPTTLGGKINNITINVDILVHKDCLRTAHGNRVVCIYEALSDALCNCVGSKTTIGNITLTRILPILGIVKDFEGYTIQYELSAFRGI